MANAGYRSVKYTGGSALVVFLLFIAILVGVSAFGGWIVMLFFGLLHGSVSSSVPALGFFVSWAISFLFSIITNRFRPRATT